MKIIHVCSSDITARFLLNSQLLFFKSKGAEVTVVCSDGPWIHSVEKTGIKVKVINISREVSPGKDVIALYQLIQFFRREKPDIVHTHTMKGALLGLTAARVAGVKHCFNTIHGFFFSTDSKPLKRYLFSRLEKLHATFCTHTFCQNPIDTDLAIRMRLVKNSSITTIGNGIDVNRFSIDAISAADKTAMRKNIALSEKHFVVGIIARMVREKGYLELAKAFGIFQADKSDARLLLIGEPDTTKADALGINDLLKYIPVEKCIHVTHTDDVPLFLSCMDLYVLPSYREGYPRSVLEASSMGLPCIVGDSNGGRVAVEHNVTGYLVPIGNHTEIAKNLETLYNSSDLREKMGRSAREKAEKDFDETAVFSKIYDGYNRFLGKCR